MRISTRLIVLVTAALLGIACVVAVSLHELSNAVRMIEGAFREVLALDGDQQAGILPMKVPAKEETPELVTA